MSRSYGAILAALLLAALAGPWLGGRDGPADLSASLLPPLAAGYPLGTDAQGRDVLAGTLRGLRISLLVVGAAIAASLGVGVTLGLAAGLAGGVVDAVVMRGMDILSAFPALLLALLADGVMRLWGGADQGLPDGLVVAGAIGLARLPPLARLARTTTRTVRQREFVDAARLASIQAGRPAWRGVAGHVLPNVLGPVVVLATLEVGLAVTDEATLSFLGLGMPPERASLGTLIRLGQGDLLSGLWWPVAVPGLVLVTLVVAASRVGERAQAAFGIRT